MNLSYPATTDTPFTDAALSLKIARHTPCSACDTCPGLRPPPDVEVVLGDDDSHKSSLGDLNQYGSDEEDEPAYLDSCICGHDVANHGASEAVIGREEFSRRGRVATRLDETLQEMDKLLDFEYTDDIIVSLRQQMKLPISLITMSSPSVGEMISTRNTRPSNTCS
ncbi:hypothetical protein HYDPIDRAFT_84843 [Hydnomerulius pinastri MD-312]|nr:hypothetical protein HYDPIDRAFT_84843 [Hydnomerulius pinastri MD-312]